MNEHHEEPTLPERVELLDYVADMTGALKAQIEGGGHDVLAHLLAMAQLEARDLARAIGRPDRDPSIVGR